MLQYVVAVIAADIKDDPDTSKGFLCADMHTVSGLLFTHRNHYDKSIVLDICFLQGWLGLAVPY